MAHLWNIVSAAGITEGPVLEPGCGSGEILAAAPDGFTGIGVELDPTTAHVARARLAHAGHTIFTGSYADVTVTPRTAAAVVGNVPFGRFALYDAEHNPTRQLSIHDHFIGKSVSALAPGGIAAVITSRFTLDAANPAGRMAIARHSDFIGAVRLPSNAHKAHAGTSVITDIVVFRRREDGRAANHAPGFLERPVQHGDATDRLAISAYWSHHAEHIAGDLGTRTSQWGMEVSVTSDDWVASVDDAVAALISTVPAAAPPTLRAGPVVIAPLAQRTPAGRIEHTETGVFRAWDGTAWQPHDCSVSSRDELSRLIALRDGVDGLIELENDGQAPDGAITASRAALAEQYHSYVATYGPVNRFKYSKSGSRVTPRMGGFRKDPGWPRVAALEVYDQDTGRSGASNMLEERVVTLPEVSYEAASAADALAVSLHQTGGIDTGLIGDLLGVEPNKVEGTLGDLVFRDPTTDTLVEAGEYLSGNVRSKLAVAKGVAGEDPDRWGRNVDALVAVQPRDITADELHGMLGAPWIPTRTIQQYVGSLCGQPWIDDKHLRVVYSEAVGKWDLRATSTVSRHLTGDHQFGGEGYSALKILEHGLNGTEPVITVALDDRRVVDPVATEAARQSLVEMRDHFDTWLLRTDDDRAEAMLDIYNTRFNSLVPRSYAGLTVDPPGMNSSFKLHPHQHAAIARMVRGGNTLLAHPVGAGKTAEQIVGALELKRLGIINRPCFVVPNHMLDQFHRDIAELFPAARVLAMTTDDTSKRGRESFVARARASDWDAIITTHSAFGRWPLSDDALQHVQQRQIDQLRADLVSVREQSDVSDKTNTTVTKGIEKRIVTLEEQIKARSARIGQHQDHDALPFDQSGVDYLVVDELHEFKNLGIISSAGRIRGVPSSNGSDMAHDLADKLDHLRITHGDNRPVITGATGTPISNTVAEMWVMGRYIDPALLNTLGMGSFDAFRGQFCEVTSAMELDATGNRFRSVPRLAKYQQLPELARWWGEFTDMVRVEDLGLARPDVVGGGRQVVIVEPAAGLMDWMATEVASRAEALHAGRVDPSKDNWLKLSTDLRLAAFDWEGFSDEQTAPEHSTFATAADRIAAIYHDNAGREYLAEDRTPHPRKGSFQLVFSDLGVPSAKTHGNSGYERLRRSLIERGVPEELIAFAGDHASSPEAKERFFEQCRTGVVGVAISSTSRMGMGTNVQNRLIALHHLNAPWRPSDMEQREGRIVRRGNQNAQVEIYAYATERSASVTAWQTLERKAGFIGQVMRAEPDGPRSVDVVDDEALSYGEIKALATGDPDFQRLAELEHDLSRLERLSRSHARLVNAARLRAGTAESALYDVQQRITLSTPFAEAVAANTTGGDEPTHNWFVEIAGVTTSKRAEAAELMQTAMNTKNLQPWRTFVIGTTSSGATATWTTQSEVTNGLLRLEAREQGSHHYGLELDRRVVNNIHDTKQLTHAWVSLSRAETRLPETIDHLHEKAAELGDRLASAQHTIDAPFSKREELDATRTAVAELKAVITERYVVDEGVEDEPPPTVPLIAGAERRDSELPPSRLASQGPAALTRFGPVPSR